MRSKTLLFYFSDEKCHATPAVVPTLARLADKVGADFESYICTRPQSWRGQTLPFTGHSHDESFYFLANFYDKIVYCSLTDFSSFQFKREIMAFGGDIVSCRKPSELVDFYREMFTYFRQPIPELMTIIPQRPQEGLWLAPYCYPDIYFQDTLGVSEDNVAGNEHSYASLGIKKIGLLYCDASFSGLPFEQLDTLQPDDTYASVTSRIADRWIDQAKGIGFGDASCVFKWNAYFCREKIISLYEPIKWREFAPVVGSYAQKIGNQFIVGSQTVIPMTDDVITEFSKYGMIFSLIGVDPRFGFTIQARHPLPVDWLGEAAAPWEVECSDEYLLEKIKRRATPVCFLFYAADLGHLPVLPRIIDLMSINGMKAGLAFPSSWYEYQPEFLEQLYIPLEQGGIFPQLEPMLSSVGVAVAPESEGLIEAEVLTTLLKKAQVDIAKHVGPKMIPPGYYSFQDACPYYKHGTGEPQFDAVAEAGIKYYFSYEKEGTRAKIVYENNGMTALNQQIIHWFTSAGDPKATLKKLDQEYSQYRDAWRDGENENAADWIVMGFDMPYFGLSPSYFGGDDATGNSSGMHAVYKSMRYALDGGDSGELFLLKPHELFRYAKLLEAQQLKRPSSAVPVDCGWRIRLIPGYGNAWTASVPVRNNLTEKISATISLEGKGISSTMKVFAEIPARDGIMIQIPVQLDTTSPVGVMAKIEILDKTYELPVEFHPVAKIAQQGIVESMNDASFKVIEDESLLKFIFDVKNAMPSGEPGNRAPWEQDCIEMFFDTTPELLNFYDRQVSSYNDYVGRVFVNPYASADKQLKVMAGKLDFSNVKVECIISQNGYTAEIHIPKAALILSGTCNCGLIGFDVQIDYATGSKKANRFTRWNSLGDAWYNRLSFGYLRLLQ